MARPRPAKVTITTALLSCPKCGDEVGRWDEVDGFYYYGSNADQLVFDGPIFECASCDATVTLPTRFPGRTVAL